VDLAPDSLGPTVDVALLADAVQAVRGKLFVLGGGWDTLWVRTFPARHPSLAIGLRLRVPSSWGEEFLKVSVELQDADGGLMLPQPLAHSVRLPTHGESSTTTDFGLIRSFTFNNLVFRKEGSYSFVISVDDEPVSRLRFSVKARPADPDPPQ
jgi:hypothetical protein